MSRATSSHERARRMLRYLREQVDAAHLTGGRSDERAAAVPGPQGRAVGSSDGDTRPSAQAGGSRRSREAASARPHLRLVGEAAQSRPPQRMIGQPIETATDPRWVLAVKTAELLQGPILRPEEREKLVEMGRRFGLTAFDSNLIIAIVQDQARRGFEPAYCPTAGEAQLEMIPLPNAAARAMQSRPIQIALILTGLLALEIFLLRWFLG